MATTGIVAAVVGSAAAVAGAASLLPLLLLVIVFVVIRLPGVVLAAYLLIPFYKGFVQDAVPVDLTIVLALANVASLLVGIGRREQLRMDASGLVLWLLLNVVIALGVAYAPDRALAADTLMRWVGLVAIPLMAVVRVGATTGRLRQFLWSFLAFGFIMILVGALAVTPGERLSVLGTNTIGVARASLVVPIIAFGFVLHERGALIRIVTLVAVPASLVIALASGSRGPVLALFALVLAAVVTRAGHGGSWGRRAGVLSGALAAGVVTLLFIDLPTVSLARYDVLIAELSSDVADRYVDTSLGARLTLYDIALSRFGERPLFGYGTAAFATVSGSLRYPHNIFLQFAADFGAVGVVAVVAALGAASLRRPRGSEWSTVRLLMFFFMLNAMVSGDAYTDRTMWGFVLMLLLAMPAAGNEGRGHSRDREVGARGTPGDPVLPAPTRRGGRDGVS